MAVPQKVRNILVKYYIMRDSSYNITAQKIAVTVESTKRIILRHRVSQSFSFFLVSFSHAAKRQTERQAILGKDGN